MTYKKDFIKRERVDANKIPTVKESFKRKDEPFVLMFRGFIFFDVKSYECRNGDLYIRNLVDGIVLKRYFRMGSDDQLTVFKNRKEFDEFMYKVKEEGYFFGPPKSIKSYACRLSGSISVDSSNVPNEHVKEMTYEASRQFILESYMPVRDSDTGEIIAITSLWDGESFTRNDNPAFFNKVADVLEEEIINGHKGGVL